jgi:translation initiation factor 2A
MGIAARNEIYFNPQGNILLLCGFGNLPGSIEIWEIKKHKKLISSYKNPNTTQLEWLSGNVSHLLRAKQKKN